MVLSVERSPERLAHIADHLEQQPRGYLDFDIEELFSLPSTEQDRLRLAWARRRFAELAPSIEMVKRSCLTSQTTDVTTFDDLLPLLYSQDTFKSYPQSWLEAGDFARLTKWLGKLTSADLSKVDTSECELIEDWITALGAHSDVDMLMSAGAEGKAAFEPRTRDEWRLMSRGGWWLHLSRMRDEHGRSTAPRPGVDRVPLIHPGARYGTRSWRHMMDGYESLFGEGLVDALPDRNDADLLSLAGRIREASKKGVGGSVQISPRLLARKDEIAEINATRPLRVRAMIERMARDYQGRRVFFSGTMQMLYDLGQLLKSTGLVGAYTDDSYFFCGGGFAGAPPDNWKADTAAALGVRESGIVVGYGMVESLTSMALCAEGRYHIPVTTIPFILDPESDRPLPRRGTQTGRYAFFDALPETSWGGYISSDLLTIEWDEPCGCGRHGPHLDSKIARVADRPDDKIGCAGTANALEDASDFLIRA